MQNKNIIQNNVVSLATRLWLVKCYDRKKVKSLVDLTIIHVVWSRGNEPTTKKIYHCLFQMSTRLTAGGVGCSGTAVTASVNVTPLAPTQTVTGPFYQLWQMWRQTWSLQGSDWSRRKGSFIWKLSKLQLHRKVCCWSGMGYGRLSGSNTARGTCTGLLTVGPTKV